MTAYTLTGAASVILQDLAHNGGHSSILLSRAASSIQAAVSVEHAGAQLEAVVIIGDTTNSLFLPAGDSANDRHLVEFVEAIANGTLDTAASPAAPVFVEHDLLPCWKCKGAAIGFDYCAPGPGTRFLHGAKCRHGDCQQIMDCESEAAAADRWNAIQSAAIGDHLGEATDMVNHPPHYNGHPSGVECIEVTERLPFNLGNAFKYVFRHRAKNGHEDLMKAQWYLTRELDRCERGGISLGDLQAANALASRIAAHESYPIGACLVAISSDEPREALHWLSTLTAH
ncbi:DUF3310 domain-containing protein [Pseudomonas nitroreducens]|uniref:DUF3310 domain-containing protein n=1 Tax=Pseudomonas nitroreducens TaxID=46680 RepID=UPI0004665D66|nr:DUF3310 domain-containing protein [Pseudomonas nitroreducens]